MGATAPPDNNRAAALARRRRRVYAAAMRYAELALICLPGVLLFLWFLGLRHANQKVLVAIALALAALGAALFWMGEDRAVRGAYVPAHLQGGQIIPGEAPGDAK